MAGTLRIYTSYYTGLMRGRFLTHSDTYKLALVGSGYVPNPTVTDRQPGTSYVVGDVVLVAAWGMYFVAATSGISGSGTPVYSGVYGAFTTDGTVIWECAGVSPPSAHVAWSEVSANEVSDAIYPAGGVTIPSTSVTTTGGLGHFLAGDLAIQVASTSVKYAVIYKLGTVDSVTNPLVAYIPADAAGAVVSIVSGYYRFTFSQSGLLTVGG